MCPYINIGNFTVPVYLLCAVAGIIFSFSILCLTNKICRSNSNSQDLITLIGYVFVGVVFGSKIFQAIGILAKGIINDTPILLHSFFSGMGVFYGGLIGGFTAVIAFSKSKSFNLMYVCNKLIPSVLAFHSFGRLGCFFSGCCFGIEASWGMVFQNSFYAPNNIKIVPVQLIGCGLNLIFLIILLCINKHGKQPFKYSCALYLIFYSVIRFLLEFLRGDEGRGIYILSVSQWISIPVLFAGIYLMLKTNRLLNADETN